MEEAGRTGRSALRERKRKYVESSEDGISMTLCPQRFSSTEGGVVGRGRRGSSPWEQPGPEHGLGPEGIGTDDWCWSAGPDVAGCACLLLFVRGEPMRT